MDRASIVVRGLRLWAHVGVLESERICGQWFELDLQLGLDAAGLAAAASSDDLASCLDYSQVVQLLQRQASSMVCRTIEHYSEQILMAIEQLYGPVAIQLELRKCAAPIAGFDGIVAIQRCRRWPLQA
ncbi:dihydroneopterin aldolase [Cyanobium sp. HWJ4-Hawea]|uniref:dihydroneopterin aldolase n=1 Tax=unclassified Cyanobium TaxID=2627006 RepID=UPI0020CB8190|nr:MULTISPECIES: dihydroneopterin aldolase [unclassified Cyanobium]MCP9774700.1 dihydroneopterin aldolase [Cyanobium sp. WAJ14-Wanaka]MCP9809311.1 dihydroneopterin aldolase [Cyanobium sp. HWJ4-Hawea]